ncbi:MAG: NUDIX domain-containing protein [Bacteroidota bacterium]
MPISDYLRELRGLVGHRLLLLPSVAAVIHDEHGDVLLVKSAAEGRWSLPAGGIEPGETPEEAVCREVAEETGLAVRSTRLLGVVGGQDYRVTYQNGDRVEYTVAVFACTVDQAELTAVDGEVSAFDWVEPSTVSERLDLPYPGQFFHHPTAQPTRGN